MAWRPACEVPKGFKNLEVYLTSSTTIGLVWREPIDDGACLILSYQVMVDDGSQGAFTTYGSALGASTFTLDLSGLTVGSEYRFYVVVTNVIGSSNSNVVSSVVADVPNTPSSAPGFVQSETNSTAIRVTMPEIVQNGGSAITTYNLQRTEAGSSVWFDVAGSAANYSTSTEITVTGLHKRQSYKFRYRVANLVGWSDWSPDVYLTAALTPSAPP